MSELRGSATVSVSGEYSGSYTKDKAVDANLSTEWVSGINQGNNAWIQFDWGSPVTIREMNLYNRSGLPWGVPRFTFSDATYIDGLVPLTASLSNYLYVLQAPKSTTSVRISVSSDGGVNAHSDPGFREVYINDAYTTPPSTTDLTIADQLVADSIYDGNYIPYYAIDGNTATEWAALNTGSSAYLQFTWLNTVRVDSVQLRDRSAGSGTAWGTPRFTFSDSSYQDGGGAVSNSGYTTYNLTPKLTTSLKIGIASGGSGLARGLAEVIITGSRSPSGAKISLTGAQIIA